MDYSPGFQMRTQAEVSFYCLATKDRLINDMLKVSPSPSFTFSIVKYLETLKTLLDTPPRVLGQRPSAGYVKILLNFN